MKFRLIEKSETISTAFSVGTDWYDVGAAGGDSFSLVANIDVDTPSAKTFDSGVAADLEVQDLTYVAVDRGEAGDEITIEYVGDGTAGAETVDVTGTAIVVHMDPTAVTGSSADDILAAIEASVPADALVSVSVTGTGVTVQAVAAEAPLAGGVDSEVNVDDDEITIPAHGLSTGLKGQLTTTGTLPAGLALATDYFVIVVDENTIQLAASLLLAQAGTAVPITGQGSSAAVNTFTATALAGGTIKLQQANDTAYPVDLGSATNVTVDAVLALEKDRPTMRYVRGYLTLTAGHLSADIQVLVKGDKD